MNETLRYVLAVASERFGVALHAYCVMSNHLHIVFTDIRGNCPAFEQYLDSLVARSVNSLHGRWESFWAPGSYSAVKLTSAQDLLAKCAYVLANPVAAGLVRRGSEWPGLRSAPEQVGAGPIAVRRPMHFFRAEGPMPETAALRVECPEGFASDEDFRQQLVAAVTVLEDAAASELASSGRSFLGVRRILAQKPDDRPASLEPRRALNPRIGCRDKWKRIEGINRLKSFLADYRKAWAEFASGIRDTVFPHGTYWMRVTYGVQCTASG